MITHTLFIKKIVISFILMGISYSAPAQKNVVKATEFFFPIPTVFTFGAGYERLITDQISLQLNYSYFAYQMTYTGDNGGVYRGIVPQVRYYFGPQESYRQQIFVGIFTEFFKMNEFTNSEDVGSDYYGDISGDMINPGILFGKNFSLGKRFHLEVFIGWRYEFIDQSQTYYENGIRSTISSKEQSSGVTLGFNFAYSF